MESTALSRLFAAGGAILVVSGLCLIGLGGAYLVRGPEAPPSDPLAEIFDSQSQAATDPDLVPGEIFDRLTGGSDDRERPADVGAPADVGTPTGPAVVTAAPATQAPPTGAVAGPPSAATATAAPMIVTDKSGNVATRPLPAPGADGAGRTGSNVRPPTSAARPDKRSQRTEAPPTTRAASVPAKDTSRVGLSPAVRSPAPPPPAARTAAPSRPVEGRSDAGRGRAADRSPPADQGRPKGGLRIPRGGLLPGLAAGDIIIGRCGAGAPESRNAIRRALEAARESGVPACFDLIQDGERVDGVAVRVPPAGGL